MGLNTYPSNPFPPSTDRMDADVLEAEVSELKSGLTNVNTALSVPEGSGKNWLNANIAEAKANNTDGTWDGNTYTESGVTFACSVNSDGYITKVHVTGTATAQVSFSLTKTFKLTENAQYILNGCPAGGSLSNYRLTIYTSVMDTQSTYGTDKAFTYKSGNNPNAYIRVYSGYEVPSAGLDFYPMARPEALNDPTFVSYIPSVESRIEALNSNLANKANIAVNTSITGQTINGAVTALFDDLHTNYAGGNAYVLNGKMTINGTNRRYLGIAYIISDSIITGLLLFGNDVYSVNYTYNDHTDIYIMTKTVVS